MHRSASEVRLELEQALPIAECRVRTEFLRLAIFPRGRGDIRGVQCECLAIVGLRLKR